LFPDETTNISGFLVKSENDAGKGQAIYGGIKGDTPEMGNNRRAIARRNELDGRNDLVPQVLSN
jgi:hypothetical protein